MMVYGGNATPANIGGTVQEPVVLYHIGSGFHVSGLNDKFSASASYRAGLSPPLQGVIHQRRPDNSISRL